MQHGHSAPKIFSSLFKSPIVQSSQPKGRFGKIDQRCIDQCSMVAGHGLYTECQPDRPQGSHDFNWIIQAGINLLYMRSKANQIFNCLIDQTDNVGIWLGIAERPAVSDAQFLDAITKPVAIIDAQLRSGIPVSDVRPRHNC